MTDFAATLESWYKANGRELPWRKTEDPYRIWISEIILQQTRVDQGYAYYQRFLKRFPTVEALGCASIDEVMLQWQGLGYYSRARNLHAAAQHIVEIGAFPKSYDEVRALRGVGDYTAAAICSFAYGMPLAVVDGNVYRVLARVYGIRTAVDTAAGKKEFAQLAQQLLDNTAPAIYNQAIMDFGALICSPQRTRCEDCPMMERCVAYAEGCVDELPVKSKRTKVRNRYLSYIIILEENEVLIHKRGEGDIWTGLYEPLLIENTQRLPDVLELWDSGLQVCRAIEGLKHQLSHQTIYANAYLVKRNGGHSIDNGYCNKKENSLEQTILEGDHIWVRVDALGDYACSRLVSEIYSRLLDVEL